jgi:hypothetical protein
MLANRCASRSRLDRVGAELLRRIVERMVERGITDVQLFAAAGRRPFYERNGFVTRPDNAPGMQLNQATG